MHNLLEKKVTSSTSFTKAVISLLLVLSVVRTHADVRAEDASVTRFIKITVSGTAVGEQNQEQVSFELCDRLLDRCTPIGKQKAYLTSDLIAKRKSEYIKMGVKIGVGVVVVAAAAYSSAVYALLNGSAIAAADGGLSAALLGGAGAMLIGSQFDAINPYYNWRISQAIRPEVIADQDLTTSDIDGFARDLGDILDK